MDKIGEANKPFEARVEDHLQNERKKNEKEEMEKEEEKQKKVVHKPEDVGVVDTSAFIKTKMLFGLDRVFRLSDPVIPGEKIPDFLCNGLVGGGPGGAGQFQ